MTSPRNIYRKKVALPKSPSETVFIFFEDYVKDDASFRAVVDKYKGFLYGEEIDGKWSYPRIKDKTGTLQQMDGKFLLFMDHTGYYPYTYDYCIETVYGDDSLDKNLAVSCVQRGESKATNTTVDNYPFLIVNNFPTWDRFIVNKAVMVGSGLLIGLGFLYPPLGLLGGLGLLGSAIAESFHKGRIEAINNANDIIKKIQWVQQDADVSVGKYHKVPNFVALDYVLTGNSINAIGFAIEQSLKNYMAQHAELSPSFVLLAEYLLADKSDVSAILRKKDGTEKPLTLGTIDGKYKVVQLENIDQEYQVHLLWSGQDIYIGDVKFSQFEELRAWFFEYQRKFVDYEAYAPNIPQSATVSAYMEGLFTQWIDIESGQIKTNPNAQFVKSRLNTNPSLAGIDVNFIDVKGISGSNYYNIYLQINSSAPVLCAVCYDKTTGLQALPVANNVTRIGTGRTRKKCEIPPGYFLSHAPKHLVNKFYRYVRDNAGSAVVALPAVTSFFAYSGQSPEPISLISSVYATQAGQKICDIDYDMASLQFNLTKFALDTEYFVIAVRASDGKPVTLARFSLTLNEGKPSFATFNYLASGV